ncbi:MAG: HAD-IA family hydrolase [Methylococcales bacterium]|jgi:phosphoglycolate phosphatase|nr:HAD-IA family hydrolase [Methylococcales bacterium]
MHPDFSLDCMLFDLDGTLLDTAPDLISSLNYALKNEGFNPVPWTIIKPYVSYGAVAMIKHSITDAISVNQQNKLLTLMLDHYEANVAIDTDYFSGIPAILEKLERKKIKWGIVTNKRSRFTTPLVSSFGLDLRADCIISGDSTAYPKPNPLPLLTACKQSHVLPQNCIYIGDALHDIEAGKQAKMGTIVATYGYLKNNDQPDTWGADALINHAAELDHWI